MVVEIIVSIIIMYLIIIVIEHFQLFILEGYYSKQYIEWVCIFCYIDKVVNLFKKYNKDR